MYMCPCTADAMWYHREHESGKKTGLQIGPVSFTIQTIWVSIASLLTALPVVIVMVYIFGHYKTGRGSNSNVVDDDLKLQIKVADGKVKYFSETKEKVFWNINRI